MSTLNTMSEQVLRLLAGGDVPDDFRFEREEIILAIGQTFGEAIAAKLEEKFRKNPRSVTPELLTVYRDQEVLEDSELDLRYTVLPADYQTLPYDKGVWFVGAMRGQEPFKRIGNGSFSLYSNLEAGNMNGHVGYYIEGNRIYYPTNPPDLDLKILIKMVAKPSDIDPDAKLPIPSDMEAYIIREVVELFGFGMQQDQDYENDSVNE